MVEIYIAAPREYHTLLSQFLSEYGNTDSSSVEFIWVDRMTGSADGLRAVNERIRFVVSPGLGLFQLLLCFILRSIPFGLDAILYHELYSSYHIVNT